MLESDPSALCAAVRRGFLQECARGTRLLTLRGGGEDSEELDGMNGYASTDPVVQFGKGGHIEQIEFAMRAVQKGLTVIAVKVFLNPSPPLLQPCPSPAFLRNDRSQKHSPR
jgi:hypothetical protein